MSLLRDVRCAPIPDVEWSMLATQSDRKRSGGFHLARSEKRTFVQGSRGASMIFGAEQIRLKQMESTASTC